MIAVYAALTAAVIIAILGGIVLLLPDRTERDRSFDAHVDQALAVVNEPAAVDELAARRAR